MEKIDLTKITLDDLIANSFSELALLQELVQKAIESKKHLEKEEAREKIKSIAEESGFSLNELFTNGKIKASKTKAPIKYRDPDDPSLTWSGRGRKPKWIGTYLASGKLLVDIEIV